ncbi:sugar ABC transporter ATP-binding protein [Jannaschia sp. CCS1]|uniref:sugar ABC transporter ATP-binding protein n=1 Tax=Jannaschia sp. (strain CCS1) TaxID=290400 RepID=UPI000053ADDA|nr:sugar ABC transporter ATP-binding protein [Jannaschia sp. CCS1]ABD55975.1 monosaccharide ABC transporter ATP-binding protein, CUT2 family [Jannaschia sp. CCS1]
MRAPTLEYRNMSKSFFGVPAVRGVDLTLAPGTILALIGENGAGKSTMMNMLGGVLEPDAGTMTLDGQPYAPAKPADATAAGIAFIHQELNLFENLSIAENVFIDRMPRTGPFVRRRAMEREAAKMLARVGLDVSSDTKVERLAPGERQLVEIAKALASGARIIILDEPTTSLTNRETERLFAVLRELRSEGCSMIYISHVLQHVLDLADDVVVLRDGTHVGGGPIADFDVPRMISMMVGREIDQLFPQRTVPAGEDVVLSLEGVSQPGICRDVSLQVHKGEVLGIFGLMGAGRTELARIVFGLDPHVDGTVTLNGDQLSGGPRERIASGMAFVTEDRRAEGLLMDSDIRENMGLVALPRFKGGGGFLSQQRLLESAREIGAKLRLKAADESLSQPCRSLSGGNQQKVVIGKWLVDRPALLIMDEPTRGIDVGAKYEVFTIMNELAAEGTGILYVSSELEELMGVADRILVMREGEVAGRFEKDDYTTEGILASAFGSKEAAA